MKSIFFNPVRSRIKGENVLRAWQMYLQRNLLGQLNSKQKILMPLNLSATEKNAATSLQIVGQKR